jgi:hypothetical protein
VHLTSVHGGYWDGPTQSRVVGRCTLISLATYTGVGQSRTVMPLHERSSIHLYDLLSLYMEIGQLRAMLLPPNNAAPVNPSSPVTPLGTFNIP